MGKYTRTVNAFGLRFETRNVKFWQFMAYLIFFIFSIARIIGFIAITYFSSIFFAIPFWIIFCINIFIYGLLVELFKSSSE